MQVRNNTSETEKPSYDASYHTSSHTQSQVFTVKLCGKKKLDLIVTVHKQTYLL